MHVDVDVARLQSVIDGHASLNMQSAALKSPSSVDGINNEQFTVLNIAMVQAGKASTANNLTIRSKPAKRAIKIAENVVQDSIGTPCLRFELVITGILVKRL